MTGGGVGWITVLCTVLGNVVAAGITKAQQWPSAPSVGAISQVR